MFEPLRVFLAYFALCPVVVAEGNSVVGNVPGSEREWRFEMCLLRVWGLHSDIATREVWLRGEKVSREF